MTNENDHQKDAIDQDRRRVMTGVAGAAAAGATVMAGSATSAATPEAMEYYADPETPGLPDMDMDIDPERTALVVVDPQVDFLDPNGVAWGVVGESVTEQGVVDNLERLFIAAKAADMPVVVSPHYYFPQDHKWKFEGTLERVMHSIHMFDRNGPLNLEGFEGSGADWMPQYKKYINDGKTIVCSPHKVYGPEQNDLVLQLRKIGVDKVILAGMSANLCVESHMRELLETGFEVAVVRDATAGAKVPEGDGYLAALINFRMIANAVWWTDEAVQRIAKGA
ncbi:isochorismatase [Actibacterium mucosum KCTC 23349]|uniref:Isochorismatase n=1 Tax=Actibacterium mucosum KCTC 23349 TaxID=1454373 RepID=A0A037ZHT1_9RHOB|nr:cysteine hydrolase [Actibacterium mucosum]KAJ54350.1 isochorismatase [Actibacterium mucosum KCTC 23349]